MIPPENILSFRITFCLHRASVHVQLLIVVSQTNSIPFFLSRLFDIRLFLEPLKREVSEENNGIAAVYKGMYLRKV